MKIKIFALFLLIIFVKVSLSQDKLNEIGVRYSYLVPIGTLSNRFIPTSGFSIFYGYKTSSKWHWQGRLEYFSFSKENRKRLNIRRKLTLQDQEQIFEFPLPKLDMYLNAFGLSASANYYFYNKSGLRLCLDLGFGIFRWESFRSEYFDTLRVTYGEKTYDAVILQVPSLKQLDWSGGFNLGFSSDILIFNPIWLNISTNYKAIIGELWATLNLDLENISVFQIYEVSASLKFFF